MWRRPFEKDVYALRHEIPGTVKHQNRHNDRDDRVREVPLPEHHGDTGGYGPDRAQRVAHHVKKRSSNVQVLVLRPVKQARCDEVRYKPDACDNQHRNAFYRWRRMQSVVGLIKNVDSHQNQENAVAQRGQNFHAKIAVSLFVGGGAGRDLKSEQTQRQRRHVGQHMARVSDQGQTGTVAVSFIPVSAGSFSNAVVFTSNGGNSTNPVTGIGLTPGQLTVSPASFDFGVIVVGSNAQASFVATNTGAASLSNVTASVNGGPFTISSDTSFNLPGFGFTNVVLSFSPTNVGNFSNLVVFTSANANGSTNPVTGSAAFIPAADFAGVPLSARRSP